MRGPSSLKLLPCIDHREQGSIAGTQREEELAISNESLSFGERPS